MICPTPASYAFETPAAGTQVPPVPPRARAGRIEPAPPIATNPLERLAQLMLSNERLMDDLAASRARIADARAYLDGPGCNARFGEAHLERTRIRHAGILARLRANRIEALHLLGRGDSND